MDTWGISGSTFLALYASLLMLTALAVAASRLNTAGAAVDGEDLDDYEVAVLNGEAGLPASIALVALDWAGAVELGDRMVRELTQTQDLDLFTLTARTLVDRGIGMEVTLTGTPPSGAHPVEAAVYQVVINSSSRRPSAIRRATKDLPQIEDLRRRLADRGLVRDPEEARRLGRQWRWFLPLLGLGLVRLGYDLSRRTPVGYLLPLLGITVLVMVITAKWRTRSRTTRQGDRLLRRLQKDCPAGTGRAIPGATAGTGLPDRDGAGRLLAVRGARGLWEVDRPLALAVGAGALSADVAQTKTRRRSRSSWGGPHGSEARDFHGQFPSWSGYGGGGDGGGFYSGGGDWGGGDGGGGGCGGGGCGG